MTDIFHSNHRLLKNGRLMSLFNANINPCKFLLYTFQKGQDVMGLDSYATKGTKNMFGQHVKPNHKYA